MAWPIHWHIAFHLRVAVIGVVSSNFIFSLIEQRPEYFFELNSRAEDLIIEVYDIVTSLSYANFLSYIFYESSFFYLNLNVIHFLYIQNKFATVELLLSSLVLYIFWYRQDSNFWLVPLVIDGLFLLQR